ncbi:M15 family metallopeptidase [Micromonospora sp. URMC 105]|uniref:M15 family metallopeptidase n=1 Tax=Micromonospora sp. URMC 105 TaxID=3423413 RepID=UPI003F1A9EF4
MSTMPLYLPEPTGVRAPVRLVECGDPLVDVGAVGILVRPAAHDSGPFLRSALVDRLVAAQTLLPPGLRLTVVGGWRPAGAGPCPVGRDPGWTGRARLVDRISRRAPPHRADPHLTGAAVDLTLCDSTGMEFALGSSLYARPEECDGACHTASPLVPPEPRARRLLLVHALTAMNLVNYPSAWWHWSYGDLHWATVTGSAVARYGPVPGPLPPTDPGGPAVRITG